MLAFIDWDKLELFHYIAIGGGVVLLLTLLLYLMPGEARQKLKVPAIIFGVVGGLAVGGAAGALGMTYYYEKKIDKDNEAREAEEKKKEEFRRQVAAQGRQGGGMMGRQGGGGMMGGGGGMMGGGGGMMGGGGGQSPQQLVSLVRKLDLLTGQPLKLELDEKEKQEILTQLKDLDSGKKLEEKDAKAKLDKLLKSLEKQKDILEAVGFRWPGSRGQGRPTGIPAGGGGIPAGGQNEAPNPFKEGKPAKSLKDLKVHLEKKPG